MLGFVIYGLGIGMGYYPILKTTWKYYPEKNGFLTGLILSVFGLCPFIFTSIVDAVMNPDAKSTNDDGLYNEEIALKMKNFSLIMVIVMGACGILSQILMFPMDNVVSTDNNQVVVEEDNDKKADAKESYASNEIFNNENEAPLPTDNNEPPVIAKEEEKKTIYVQEPFMQAFKSLRFHLFNFMSVGTLCK